MNKCTYLALSLIKTIHTHGCYQREEVFCINWKLSLRISRAFWLKFSQLNVEVETLPPHFHNYHSTPILRIKRDEQKYDTILNIFLPPDNRMLSQLPYQNGPKQMLIKWKQISNYNLFRSYLNNTQTKYNETETNPNLITIISQFIFGIVNFYCPLCLICEIKWIV